MGETRRALITGASGFVGGHLARYLHEKDLEIWASFHSRQKQFPFRIRWVRADIAHPNECLELVRKSRPNYIFHLAGQAVPNESWEDPGTTFQVNAAGTLFLLEGVVRFAPQARVVLISSSQVYGSTFLEKRKVCEIDQTNPVTPYGASKLLMELGGLDFFKRNQLRVVIARAFNQVGKEQNPSFVFADFCRQIALIEKRKKPPILRVGNVEIVRDFVHVDDAVRAYYILATRGKKGETYNVGSERGTQLKDVLEYLKRESRLPFKMVSVRSRRHRNEVPYAVADCSKLKRLGWYPRASIWEGLRDLLIEWRQKVK